MEENEGTTILIHYLQHKWSKKSFQRLLGIVKARDVPSQNQTILITTHKEDFARAMQVAFGHTVN